MESLERPDGSVVTPIGWTLILIGIVGAFIAATAESIHAMLTGFVLANLGFGLGGLLLSLAYLVRAIWFLPGREIAANQSEAAIERPSAVSCEWCDRQLPARFRTCTSFGHDSLKEISERVVDSVCQEQLSRRGYPVADAAQ